MPGEVHVVDDEGRLGALSRRGLTGAREIARMRHRQFEKADSERYADRFAWTEVLHRGWEGYVAKDPESPYVTGRTMKWLKVKQPKYREEERGFYEP